MTRTPLLALVVVMLVAPSAHAQLAVPHGVASVNAGWQAPDHTFNDSFTFEQYVETATVDVDYRVRSGPVYEGGVGVRLWRSLGVGVAFSRVSHKTAAAVTGSIPHPFFFNSSRQIQGDATGITRDETSVHIQLLAFLPTGRRMLVVLAVGPTVVAVKQRLVTAVHFDESYPFDTATFRVADSTTETANVVGFNAGADVVFALNKSFGLGALIRYTRASADLEPTGRTITVDTGGLQAGAGIRVVF